MEKLDKRSYVKKAETIIIGLSKDRHNKDVINLTKNKIRNLLTLVNELYNMAIRQQGSILSDDIVSHIQYIKMRLAYEAGRDKYVKELLTKSDFLNYMDAVGNSKDDLIILCHYMEAMVAYHRYYTKEK